MHGPTADDATIRVTWWTQPLMAAVAGGLLVMMLAGRTDASTDLYLGACALLAATAAWLVRRRPRPGRAEAILGEPNPGAAEFLATLSHEIRTPLTAIMGFAELLDDPHLQSDERREYLHILRRSSDHLLAVLNDVLDLSKIEAGRMRVEFIETRPLDVLDEVLILFEERARAKGITLRAAATSPVPLSIRSDPTRLRQVLLNLVGNAVKFTDQGGVEVNLSLQRDGSSRGGGPQLRFEVRDTGIGIGQEELARLFTPFTQADESIARRYGGSGLGLSICRRLAELLGGDVSCSSEPGHGSVFVFTVATGDLEGVPLVEARTGHPAVDVATVDSTAADPAALAARILVADDSDDGRRLVAFHLGRAGADVVLVANGRLAVERALSAEHPSAGERPFDLVLMDLQMPEMDGFQATAELRRRGWAKPIVALTAHASADLQAKALAAGCDAVETKPIGRRRLLAACEQWARASRALRRAA